MPSSDSSARPTRSHGTSRAMRAGQRLEGERHVHRARDDLQHRVLHLQLLDLAERGLVLVLVRRESAARQPADAAASRSRRGSASIDPRAEDLHDDERTPSGCRRSAPRWSPWTIAYAATIAPDGPDRDAAACAAFISQALYTHRRTGRSGRSNQSGRRSPSGPGAGRVFCIHSLYASCACSVSTTMSP